MNVTERGAMVDREKRNNLNVQRELARFEVEYKAKNRKAALKAHRGKLFLAYGPLVFFIIGSVMKIIDEIATMYIYANVETFAENEWGIRFWAFFNDIAILPMVIASVVNIIAVVVFVIDAFRNSKFSTSKKVFWSILFIGFHWIIFPIYFNKHVLYDNLEKAKEDYIANLEGRVSTEDEKSFEEQK